MILIISLVDRIDGNKTVNEKSKMLMLSLIYSYLPLFHPVSFYFQSLFPLSSYLLSILRSSSSPFSSIRAPSILLSPFPPFFFQTDKQTFCEASSKLHAMFNLWYHVPVSLREDSTDSLKRNEAPPTSLGKNQSSLHAGYVPFNY